MQVSVSGQQIDIGDALRAHVAERLGSGVGKYFDNSIEAAVGFAREGHGYRSTTSVHVHAGLTLYSEGSAGDIYASFDKAAERLEKQLRRYKARLKDHKGKGAKGADLPEAETGRAFVLDGGGETAPAEPAIIAENPASVPTLGVGDAVMRLDLGRDPVLMFRNAKTGGLNVVYRRADGHVGWIDPGFDPKRG
jgi:ribosomal subunit interface protein